MKHGTRSRLFTATALLCALGTTTLAQEAETTEPVRFARVAEDGATVRNLADEKGKVIARPAKDTLLAVYRELSAGWLEVEVPGGFAVFVFGRFLQPTAEADVFEVTRNAVNIRPEPSGDVTNFPLPQRLHAGDRLRVVEPLPADAVLEETWVRVWSPPGVRGLIKGTDTRPLEAGVEGPGLWTEALVLRSKEVPLPPAPVGGNSVTSATDDKARAMLDDARTFLDEEVVKGTPDFEAARVKFREVLALSPNGPVSIEARYQLQLVDTYEEASVLRNELALEKERRREEVLRQQKEVWERSRAKDPLGGVFLARGVLERAQGQDGVPRYFLRFGNEVQSELFCNSGRYDLETFTGLEVGVLGSELDSVEEGLEARMIDVSRLEIIALR